MQQSPYGSPNYLPPTGYSPAPVTAAPVASAGTIAVVLLLARGALPLLFRALGMAGIRPASVGAYDGIRLVLSIAALVAYFIWFARLYGWVRTTRGTTSYSTGLAIGGWFIPFANIALPFLGLNDAYKRTMNGQGSPLVLLWWLGYIVMTLVSTYFSMLATNPSLAASSAEVMNALGWVSTALQVGTYGLWALIVRTLTSRATA